MKHKHFYSHLLSLADITNVLQTVNMSENERVHLLTIIESHLHYTIIDVVLANLSTDDKETFLSHTIANKHEKTWKFLLQKIEHIEEKIKTVIDEVQTEFLNDIAESKGKQ